MKSADLPDRHDVPARRRLLRRRALGHRPAKRLGDGAHALLAWAFRPVGKA
jgi:hypothetical protein